MRSTRPWAALLLVSLLAACGEPLTPPARAPLILDPKLNVTTTASLDAQITELIATLFPNGLETAAGTRWESVKSKHAAGQTDPAQLEEAKTKLFELVRWIEGKNGRMDDPQTGETPATAAARLVGYMAMYVFQGPLTPVPTYNTGADATFEIVDPAEDDTVTTPATYAGANFDAGTFSEPVIVTISQNPNPFPVNCSGPLTTTLCQYPRFYDFHVYPVVAFQKPAHLAVCHFDEGMPRGPLDLPGGSLHDRLRLAHPLPADANDRVAGGTVRSGPGENIEILPRSPLSDQGSSGVQCDAEPIASTTRLGGLMNRFASAVGRALTPRSLYAVDFGPEHDTEFMSPFNLVDPAGEADLTVGSMSGTPTAVLPGGTVSSGFTVFNTSPVNGGTATATSGAGTATLYLSSDAVITASDVMVGSTPVAALVPDASQVIAPVSIVIPATTAPGSYHLGVIVTQPIAEANGTNNSASVPVTIMSVMNMDGIMSAGEWSGAHQFSFQALTPAGLVPAVVHSKRDASKVYFAVEIQRPATANGAFASFEFDLDGDGQYGEAGDDAIITSGPTGSTGLFDAARSGSSTTSDVSQGGTSDGQGAIGGNATVTIIEVSHPLNSGDGKDIALTPTNPIAGININVRIPTAAAATATSDGEHTFTAISSTPTFCTFTAFPSVSIGGCATSLPSSALITTPENPTSFAPTTVMPGGTKQLSVVTRDHQGTPLTGAVCTWNSTNPSIATVSGSGLVTGNASGTATVFVTCSQGGGQVQGMIKVTVAPLTMSITGLSSSTFAIEGAANTWTVAINNPGPALGPQMVLQTYIVQGSASRAASGWTLSCPNLGILSTGSCNQSFTSSASNGAAGNGTIEPGSATLMIELKENSTVLTTASIPITLQ